MALIRAQANLERDSRLPKDRFVNTFHFVTPIAEGATTAELDAIVAAVIDFYNGTSSASGSIGSFMSELLAGTAVHRVKVYDMGDPEPRPTVRDVPFGIAAATGQSLPADVALCLSYRAATVAGGNPARRRGRVYLGPLDTSAASTSVNLHDVIPNGSLLTAVVEAGARLMALAGIDWVVWSPTDLVAARIDHVWADDQWDTQRRRGGQPTTRQTRTRP